jgi:hypothetical protein
MKKMKKKEERQFKRKQDRQENEEKFDTNMKLVEHKRSEVVLHTSIFWSNYKNNKIYSIVYQYLGI